MLVDECAIARGNVIGQETEHETARGDGDRARAGGARIILIIEDLSELPGKRACPGRALRHSRRVSMRVERACPIAERGAQRGTARARLFAQFFQGQAPLRVPERGGQGPQRLLDDALQPRNPGCGRRHARQFPPAVEQQSLHLAARAG